jgi:cysteine synthase
MAPAVTALGVIEAKPEVAVIDLKTHRRSTPGRIHPITNDFRAKRTRAKSACVEARGSEALKDGQQSLQSTTLKKTKNKITDRLDDLSCRVARVEDATAEDRHATARTLAQISGQRKRLVSGAV